MKKFTIGVVLAVLVLLFISVLSFDKKTEQVTQNQNENINKTEDINKINENNMETELKIEVLNQGEGAEAVNGKNVFVHYTGKLEDGTVFDSSVSRGVPFNFTLGAGQVIRGWDFGVAGMKVGEKRLLTIPADLAYGPRGIKTPDGQTIIPENATLIFEVELLDVK